MIKKRNVDNNNSKFSGRIMPKDDGAFIERTSSHGRNVSATRVVFTDSPYMNRVLVIGGAIVGPRITKRIGA
ncbi:hypothetical protein V1477_009348 [Vespula maculifrons]|uniref:Uncharacterized protein n=1 Tax=Vespula maculifrons TaxID=7453 RepID=A0ABD2CAE3_VESMC